MGTWKQKIEGVRLAITNVFDRPKPPRQDEVRRLKPIPTASFREKTIDVVFWGASRPELFERALSSFRRNVRFGGRLRYFLEDGEFDKAMAAESVRIARAAGFDGIHTERVGSYGWAMTQAIDRWVRAPLMFSIEDDWECLRPIDLDLCWELFRDHDHVNQLRYNRRNNTRSQNEGAFVYTSRTLKIGNSQYPFLGGAHWYFNPAVWRMSFIRPRWRAHKDNIHFFINSANGLLPNGPRPSPEWYSDKLGVLTWGGHGEPAFFTHLGAEQSIHAKQGRV